MAAAVVGGAVIVTGRDAIARSHDPALDAIARYHQSEAACDVVGRRLEAVVDVILNDPVARLKYADPGDSDRLAFMKIYGREVRAVQPLNDAYTVIKEARRVVGTVAASTIPGALA
ncbi:MAG: hypothetical protein O2985_16895, partial [Proteobacteria bacterium]|nr:hypothetical protein [Pseudomonadota bacterium]